VKRIIIVLAVALAACGGKKDDKNSGAPPAGSNAPTGSGSAMASTGSGSGSAEGGSGSAEAPVGQVDGPTEGDFEEDAQKRITETNFETELKTLENDLANN